MAILQYTHEQLRSYLRGAGKGGSDYLEQYDDLYDTHGEHFYLWVANDIRCNHECMEAFEDIFRGEYESLEAFVEQVETEAGGLGRFRPYINWADVARSDYACAGYYTIKTLHNTHLVFSE